MIFYFYDLETSGVNPKTARIMQFAGRRVNDKLEPIGEPDDIYIQLTRDVLPEPEAVLLTGITPQKTLQDGITEAEFVKFFHEEICTENTIFVGFNNIRFDDEFIRYILYRNFYDPYEWHWKNGCSRWDMLDVVRMTRALRPEGIKWPVDTDGNPTNRLESLTSINGLDHANAHTALSDVDATLALARLILEKQPKLFHYLLDMKDKKKVRELVASGDPFTYVSGRYESRYEKMTVAIQAKELADTSGSLVYDLRYDPSEWAKKSDTELQKALDNYTDVAEERLPFKVLQYNRCPSVAPYSVVDNASAERLGINKADIEQHRELLGKNQALVERVMKLIDEKKKSYQTAFIPDDRDPDERLYEGFIPQKDKELAEELCAKKQDDLKDFQPQFQDGRLNGLFPLYKARNFPKILNSDEREQWERYVEKRLFAGGEKSAMNKFLASLQEMGGRANLTENKKYVLEELKLYAESITPAD